MIRPLNPPLRMAALFLCLSGLACPAAHAGRAPQARARGEQPWAVSTPEAQGVSSEKLAEAVEALRADRVPVHDIVLVRHGRLILDASFFPYRRGEPHDVASVTKSITSTLVGIAIDKGFLKSVDQPITQIFPEAVDSKDPRKQRITLASLLEMRSGLDCIRTPERGEATLLEMLGRPDWVAYTLGLPMADEPGARFVYCSSGMHVLSGAISKATGRNELAFGEEYLFRPLGIRRPLWPTDGQGRSSGYGSLELRPTDMAKVGYLFLHRGVWNGRRLLSSEWIREATEAHPPGGPYGYGWWIGHDFAPFAYAADGRGSQAIAVDPALDLVAAVVAGISKPADGAEVKRLILGAMVSDAPLPPDPAGRAHLSAALARAAAPPKGHPAASLPKAAAAISGRTIDLDDNLFGLRSLTLEFSGRRTAKARISYSGVLARWLLDPMNSNRAKTTGLVPVGLDGVPRISRPPGGGLPAALDGAWTDDHSFVLRYDTVTGINKLIVTVSVAGKGVGVTIEEPTLGAQAKVVGRFRQTRAPMLGDSRHSGRRGYSQF